MNLARVVGLVAIVVVLVAIITAPSDSAATARSGGSALGSLAASLGAFVGSLDLSWSSEAAADTVPDEREVPSTYTVRRGDTLSAIAAAHSTTVDDLVEDNDLCHRDHIVVGQELSLQ